MRRRDAGPPTASTARSPARSTCWASVVADHPARHGRGHDPVQRPRPRSAGPVAQPAVQAPPPVRAGRARRAPRRRIPAHRAGRDSSRWCSASGAWGAKWAFGDPRPTSSTPRCWCGGCTHGSTRRTCPVGGRCSTSDSPTTPAQFWIVVESGRPSVCVSDPGFEVDVTITVRSRLAVPGVARQDPGPRRPSLEGNSRSADPRRSCAGCPTCWSSALWPGRSSPQVADSPPKPLGWRRSGRRGTRTPDLCLVRAVL